MVSSIDSFNCTDGGSLWITTFRLLGQLGTRVGCSGFWGAGTKGVRFFFLGRGRGGVVFMGFILGGLMCGGFLYSFSLVYWDGLVFLGLYSVFFSLCVSSVAFYLLIPLILSYFPHLLHT